MHAAVHRHGRFLAPLAVIAATRGWISTTAKASPTRTAGSSRSGRPRSTPGWPRRIASRSPTSKRFPRGRCFWLRNDGLQNQSVLWTADGPGGEPRILIDPNRFSADATVALAQWSVSPDGRHVAYAQSEGGTDWKVWRVHGLDGSQLNTVALPGTGTAAGFAGPQAGSETFFKFSTFLAPPTLYRYDVAADTVEVFRKPALVFDASPYVTEQVFYVSTDGTRVPMFIIRRRDTRLDGRNPLLLYGYGGFNVALTPAYSVPVAVWLEMGGIYAVANLRGGSEYGEAWHEAGTLLKKQNVFDDFIAAALPGVGVLDMLRYHTPSANARQWSSDYGLSEDAAQYRALRAYSPVHNVRDGTCHPPALVTTANRDDRVVPWHSYKFAATLQHAQGCPQPVLLRIETRAGHGAGKPT